jgi:hypothetical protein
MPVLSPEEQKARQSQLHFWTIILFNKALRVSAYS